MQSSGGTAALNSYGDSEWESSFTQILSRTKQNLNRINQRYSSTSTSLSLPTSSSSLSRTLPSDPIFSADREASGTYNVPSSSFLSDSDRNFLSKGKPSQLMATNSNPLFLLNGRDDAPSTVNNQADQEQKLLERLSEKLLSQLGHGIGPAHVGNREEVDVLRNKVRLLSESNESLERELRGLQSKFSACSGAIESLTAAQRERERERDREKESGRLKLHCSVSFVNTQTLLDMYSFGLVACRTWICEQARKLGSTRRSLAGANGGETQWFVVYVTFVYLYPLSSLCVYTHDNFNLRFRNVRNCKAAAKI